MVFGTFDGLHKGHLDFFKQAKKLRKNSVLVVSIARDINVQKIKKNKPVFSELERKKLIEGCGLADKVVLGGRGNYMLHIKKEKPDIIALGYDQNNYVESLVNDLERAGLPTQVVRLKPYKEHIYKNSLLKKKREI